MKTLAQDLDGLSLHCESIKIMSCAHTLGPAGLPFELLSLAKWQMDRDLIHESQAMLRLSRAARLPWPSTRSALHRAGLAPQALAAKIRRARATSTFPLLAGIELVDVQRVTKLNKAQIAADLDALRSAGVNGLVLSWDLWHIPLEWLELVRMG